MFTCIFIITADRRYLSPAILPPRPLIGALYLSSLIPTPFSFSLRHPSLVLSREGQHLTMISLTSIVFICVASYIFWRYIVYPAFISPLSKIPNAHFTAPFSPLWILWKRCTYQENRTVQAAHEKYGKIVRIGPNDVSVNSVDDGIRVVYTGGFEKWNFYPNLFANFG